MRYLLTRDISEPISTNNFWQFVGRGFTIHDLKFELYSNDDGVSWNEIETV